MRFATVLLSVLVLCIPCFAASIDLPTDDFFAVGYHGEFTHIDPTIGEVQPTRYDMEMDLQALATSPSGISYTINYSSGLYSIDPITGDTEFLFRPQTVYPVRGMAFSPDGELYVYEHVSPGKSHLGVVDIDNGNYRTIGHVSGDATQADGMDFSPEGILYGTVGGKLYTIDLDDAEMHLVGDGEKFLQSSFSIAFTPGGSLYATGYDFGSSWPNYKYGFVKVDPDTGKSIGDILPLSGACRGLAVVPEPAMIYVDDIAEGDNDGSSWEHAYNELYDALAVAQSGDKILVAGGIYKPDTTGLGDPREASFAMINGVTIEGGYAGQYGALDPYQRDIELYETILSGDLLGNDSPVTSAKGMLDDSTRHDNSYHLFYHPDGTNLDATAVLDGFTITEGNANGELRAGGGMYNHGSSPKVISCTFSDNSSNWAGGGMYNHSSSPTVINCLFDTNSCFHAGGGMFNEESSPTVSNCIFTGNSADGNGGGMYNRRESSPIVMNCTFTGNSSGRGGGGMCNRFESSPAVTGCTFNDNSAERAGGGMFNEMSSPIISNCTFSDNSTKGEHDDGLGGGMANFGSSSPIVTGCTFNDNFAESGGGMFNEYESSPTVTDCSFTDNTAYEKGYGWEYDGGGGMHNREHSSPTVTNCIFSGNSAESGGGMFNENRSSPIVTNCTFIDNSVYIDDAYTSGYEAGGGMANWGWSSPTVTGCTFIDNSAVFGGGMDNWNSDTIVTNCIFSGNWAEWAGGAMDNWSGNQTVINCTFTGNSAYGVDRYVGGGGIYNNDDNNLTLTNCILWGNTASSGGNGITLANVSAINIDHCDIKGGLAGIDNKSYGVINWGIGNIDIDPEFVDADGDDDAVGTEDDDLRLQGVSPCVDSGDNSVVTEAIDLDGNARIFNGIVDMGAYELFNTAPVADAGDDVGALADADCVAMVMLDGSGSTDADGDALTYYWYYEDDEEPFAEGMQVEAEVGLGGHTFTLIVNDGAEDSGPDTMVVTVIDDMGPEFSVVMNRQVLWPANNKMVKVTPIFTASDNCGGEVSIELVGVTCNQEVKKGKKNKDIEIDGDDIYLRATRDGKDKAGRVYTITYIAADEAGNETVAEAAVKVPHDMGKRRPKPKGKHRKRRRWRK